MGVERLNMQKNASCSIYTHLKSKNIGHFLHTQMCSVRPYFLGEKQASCSNNVELTYIASPLISIAETF